MIILSKNSRLVKKKTSKKAIQFGKLTGYKINIMKTNCFFPILAISIFSNWKWGNIQFSYKIIKFLDNNNYSHHNAMHSSKQSSQHPLEIDLDINNFRRVVSGNEARQQRVQKWMENWADSLGGQKRLAVKWDSQYPEGDVVSGDF